MAADCGALEDCVPARGSRDYAQASGKFVCDYFCGGQAEDRRCRARRCTGGLSRIVAYGNAGSEGRARRAQLFPWFFPAFRWRQTTFAPQSGFCAETSADALACFCEARPQLPSGERLQIGRWIEKEICWPLNSSAGCWYSSRIRTTRPSHAAACSKGPQRLLWSSLSMEPRRAMGSRDNSVLFDNIQRRVSLKLPAP